MGETEDITNQMIRLGASKARDCLNVAAAAGSYRGDHMHAYAKCLESMITPIEYSSDKEKIIDSGVFLAGRYILKREFGEIDQKTYGALGRNQFNEIDSGYKWAVVYLRGRGVERDAVCALIGWVDCKALP